MHLVIPAADAADRCAVVFALCPEQHNSPRFDRHMGVAPRRDRLHRGDAGDETLPALSDLELAEVALENRLLDPHRLGEKPIFITPNSRLNTLLGMASTVRCNHRYKLNPELVPRLQDAGLVVAARDASGSIAETVELNGHPFFVGMQGHPELKSRKEAPHPVIKAFLEAALSTRIRRSRNVSTA